MGKRKMPALLAMVAVASCAADGPVRVVERRLDSGPAPRGEALLRTVMLSGHVAARGAVGEPALAWDAGLAADAASYAAQMARTGRFAHSPQPRGHPGQGENLWTGTRGAYRLDEMFGHWQAEKSVFKRGPTPDFSTTGRFEDVGHYTQIIWRRTTRVGCAIASNDKDDYLVCRYLPAGNVVGVEPLAP